MMFLFNILLQTANAVDPAGAAAAQPTGAPAATEHVSAPILEIMSKGGVVMGLLAFCLLLTVFFMVERWIYLKNRAKIDDAMIGVIKDKLKENQMDAAMSYCERTPTSQGQMFSTGLRFLGSNMREIESAMETKASVELSAMESNLAYLSLISRIAPMLGFVGTIWGVINIFYSISQTNDLSIGAISGGLYTKMVASFAGLLVGIISFLGYQLFMRRIDRFAERLQEQSLNLLEVLTKSNL
jgi:biopolymer transport protein ExbB